MNGKEFVAWRKRLGINQQEAADQLGVSRRAVVAWESGETPISQMIELVTSYLEHRKELLHSIELIRSGTMTTGGKQLIDGRVVDRDTTAATLEGFERELAHIDGILARSVAMQVARTDMTCQRDGAHLVHVKLPLIGTEYAVCPRCWAAGDYARVAGGAGLIADLPIGAAIKDAITTITAFG